MKKEIKGAIKYLEYYNSNKLGIGTSRYAPLIMMVNEDEKIIEELLETSDFENKCNLLSFLDYGLYKTMTAKDYDEQIYKDIIRVLNKFKSLGEEKWTIDGEQWVKLLKESE